MLLINKYEIINKQDIKFHYDIYNKLLNNVSKYNFIIKELYFVNNNKTFNDFCINYKQYNKELYKEHFNKFKKLPNILIHGGTGSGKKTLINMLLREIYGSQADNIKIETYNIMGYSNNEINIDIIQSNYHMIIEATNSGVDKYMIQEIVKEYAKQKILQVFANNIPFKIIVINNVDNLSYYAQTSLRCTMERYHKTCKFILCGYQISKIIEPLRSRCLNIRVPRPTQNELFGYLLDISIKEKINISCNTINYIINKSELNIKYCLWWMDYYRNKIYNFNISWKEYLHPIIDCFHNIYKQKKIITINIINEIRNIINNILITNIVGSEIIIELLKQLINTHPEYPTKLYLQILETFSIFEIRLSKGKRCVIHIEALIMKICHICYIYK